MNLQTFNTLMYFNRPSVQAIMLGLSLLFFVPTTKAAEPELELIVLDDPQCAYCTKFKNGAGNLYNSTPYADWASITYITWSKGYRKTPGDWPAWFTIAREEGRIGESSATPTFIVYDGKQEVARTMGYGGVIEFYERLEAIRSGYEAWKETQ